MIIEVVEHNFHGDFQRQIRIGVDKMGSALVTVHTDGETTFISPNQSGGALSIGAAAIYAEALIKAIYFVNAIQNGTNLREIIPAEAWGDTVTS